MSVTESEPVTAGITVPSIAPQDFLERVTAMADPNSGASSAMPSAAQRGPVDPPRSPDPEICPHPIRVDGPGHSWTWDGDDPRIEYAGCKELRDAHNDHVFRPGQT